MQIHHHSAVSNGVVFRFSWADEDAATAVLVHHFSLGIQTVTRDHIDLPCTEKVPGSLGAAIAAVGATPLPQKFTT